MRVLKDVGLASVSLLILLLAAVGVLFLTRGTPLEKVTAVGGDGRPPAVSDPLFRRTVELFAGTPLHEGNDIRVMTSGDQTYPMLWQDLKSARRSVTVQLYYCNPGAMADTFKSIITERARAGVRVLFLRDALGAAGLTKGYIDSLRAAGVRVAPFRPLRWYQLHKLDARSHIRVVVVDGHVGYTGGFGLDDKWYGNGRRAGQWRDSNVRFTGPAVMQLQAAFAAGWVEATGELLTGDLFFPPTGFTAEGSQSAGVMHTAPTVGSTPAERFLALSITGARGSLYISNSYFLPDDDFRRLLSAAARRGVDTRVLTAGPTTDVRTTWYAGRDRYEELMRAGVRIFEYQPSMMHAKTFVVDGLWSTIGTMNFDNRSIAFNDESNLIVLDRKIGAMMDSVFLEDLHYAKEIRLEEFRQRPWTERVKERGATFLSRVL